MNRICFLGILFSLVFFTCTDPNSLGLDVHPSSEIIMFGDTTSFLWQTSETQSGDSIQTDEPSSLILGEITDDPIFGYSSSAFCTQILLLNNNIELGSNPIIDSVILSYSYNDYYGDLEAFNSIDVYSLEDDIYRDSIYYSSSDLVSNFNQNWVENYKLNEGNNSLRIKLKNEFGQEILNLGDAGVVDNQVFLQSFKGISVSAQSENTMLYLNANGVNTYLKLYYHNDASDTLSLDFELGGDAARLSLFNPKSINDINQIDGDRYIQSMGGSRLKVSLQNIDEIRDLLLGKMLNKVTLSFYVNDHSDIYNPHNLLRLVKLENGLTLLLADAYEGSTHIGGNLENGRYEFNITLYFNEILQGNSNLYQLYLFSATPAENANRTVLSEDIELTIHYSEL